MGTPFLVIFEKMSKKAIFVGAVVTTFVRHTVQNFSKFVGDTVKVLKIFVGA